MGTSVERPNQGPALKDQEVEAVQLASSDSSLSVTELTLLSLTTAYRSACSTLSSALGWYRISMSKLGLSSSNPVFLLAQRYPAEECQRDCASTPDDKVQVEIDRETERLELDFSGCLWFSYRTGFPPLGVDRLSGDAGWGCTLRSCQMLLAQALLMHFVGRIRSSTDSVIQRAKSFVVSQFHDDPNACLSIHSICTVGKKYGLVAGRWMGPYALCRAVADISSSNLTQYVKIVAIDSGGGAPCLDPARLHQEFEQIESAPSELYASGVTPKTIGLIVLVPAVLGVERLNEVYSAQLRTVLRWKQSVGIVGGRPGHSYYFLGYQGNRMICMDPHTMQSTDAEPGDTSSHRPVGVHTVSMSAIDSTMALGFHCASPEELDELVSQIQEMAAEHKQSPLLTVGTIPEVTSPDCDCDWDSSDEQEGAVGESADTAQDSDTMEFEKAVAGGSTPAEESVAEDEPAGGARAELAEQRQEDTQSNKTPAQPIPQRAWEPDVPGSGDVHSTSASEWEIVSKLSTQEE